MKNSGVLRMVLAQVAFTGMVAFVKVARQDLSTFEVAFWRSVLILPLFVFLMKGSTWRVSSTRVLSFRVLLGFSALCCFFGAAKGLTLADLSLISKLQPTCVALLAPLLIGKSEKPEPWLWAIMAVAMVGCVVLLAPSIEVGSIYGILAVFAALFSAGAHTCLRLLKSESSMGVVMWFQLGTMALGGVMCFATLGEIPIPASHLWLPLFGVGFFAVLGQFLMTTAYKMEKAPVVATASYIGPVFAVVVDFIAFSDIPTLMSLFGGGLVIGAGLLLLWLSQRK